MADPVRTRRVADKARKAMMKHVQYVPHEKPDTMPGTTSDTDAAMEKLAKATEAAPEKKLRQDLPMELDVSHEEPDADDMAADKASQPAARSKTVRRLMGAYKQSR